MLYFVKASDEGPEGGLSITPYQTFKCKSIIKKPFEGVD